MAFVDLLDVSQTRRAFLSAILRSVVVATDSQSSPLVSARAKRELRRCRRGLQESQDQLELIEYFDAGLKAVVEDLHSEPDRGARLVIVLDEFDEELTALPPEGILHLVRLADEIQRSSREPPLYVTGSVAPIVHLTHDAKGEPADPVAEFREVFVGGQVVLGMLSPADSMSLLCHLAESSGVAVSENAAMAIHELTGGHPGMILRVVSAVQDAPAGRLQEVTSESVRWVSDLPGVRYECARLWSSIDRGLRGTLLNMQRGMVGSASRRSIEALQQLGILTRGDGRRDPGLFSPVFQSFVRRQVFSLQRSHGRYGLTLLPETGHVALNGVDIDARLDEVLRRGATCFISNAGAWLTREQIANSVWKADCEERVYDLVRRLRALLEELDPESGVTIEGERDRGYRLVNPRG